METLFIIACTIMLCGALCPIVAKLEKWKREMDGRDADNS